MPSAKTEHCTQKNTIAQFRKSSLPRDRHSAGGISWAWLESRRVNTASRPPVTLRPVSYSKCDWKVTKQKRLNFKNHGRARLLPSRLRRSVALPKFETTYKTRPLQIVSVGAIIASWLIDALSRYLFLRQLPLPSIFRHHPTPRKTNPHQCRPRKQPPNSRCHRGLRFRSSHPNPMCRIQSPVVGIRKAGCG